MARYIVASLDVWGNSEDGFEVNDTRRIGSVSFPSDASDKVIFAALKKEFGGSTTGLEISSQSDDVLIFVDRKKDGKPMYTLSLDE